MVLAPCMDIHGVQIGDTFKAKHYLTGNIVEGPVVWIQPGSYRVAIQGCGCLFSQADITPTESSRTLFLKRIIQFLKRIWKR